jgi:hypothetical protein
VTIPSVVSFTQVQNGISSFIKCAPTFCFVPRLNSCSCRPAVCQLRLRLSWESNLTFESNDLLLRVHNCRIGRNYHQLPPLIKEGRGLTRSPNDIISIRQIHNNDLIRIICVFSTTHQLRSIKGKGRDDLHADKLV